MDFIQRLALILLLSIAVFLPNTAFATSTYPAFFTVWTPNSYVDPQAGCNALYTQNGGTLESINSYTYKCHNAGYYASYTNMLATYKCHSGDAITGPNVPSGANYSYGPATCTTARTCIAPQVIGTSGVCENPPTPQCTAPLVLDAATNTCKDPCEPKANQPQSYFSNTAGGGDSCVGGCVVRMDSGDCGTNAAGATGCYYDGHYTGSSCTGSETGQSSTEEDAPDIPEYDCIKQGKSWGNVNGTIVCVAAGTSGSSPTTSYSPNSSNSTSSSNTSSTGSTTTSSSDSTGSKVVSFNGDGTATTTETTTTTNSDGTQSTTQTEKTEPVADFCKDNPTNQQCKVADKGSFSGSCVDGVSTVQCDGDAAQCAMAKASAELNCALSKDDPTLTNKFNEAKNDNGSNNPAATANIQTISLPTALDASSPYAGQCNQDVTISLAGSSVTIPFSAWCDVLNALGYLFLACAYISAAYILGSAV